MKWEKRKITVPAGVVMTKANGNTRKYTAPLVFNAKRRVDEEDRPVDSTWEFYWLGKVHTVLQSQVTTA